MLGLQDCTTTPGLKGYLDQVKTNAGKQKDFVTITSLQRSYTTLL
jgi:hypothetical protein